MKNATSSTRTTATPDGRLTARVQTTLNRQGAPTPEILVTLPSEWPHRRLKAMLYGLAMDALQSTIEGIALWPETATCVGVRLDTEDHLDIVAPHGLADLINLRWCVNEACPDPSAFARRLVEKRVSEIWPLVEIVPV